MATRIEVSLPQERDYAVRIGEGVLDDLGSDLRSIPLFAKTQRIVLITDSNVQPLYLAQAKQVLEKADFSVSEITVPAGESTKSLAVAEEIWRAMAQLGLSRTCAVVALGGGVVGDLAGFVAASFMRGVPVVQVPTTLLAMVDSSVGGKTAVNLPEGKNLIGAFWQPSFVCADTATLLTLPDREWRCGCGEIAKSAVIDSDDFFFWLHTQAPHLAQRESDCVAQAIARCIVFKADVVARDKTETAGVRECLNYGHTLAHAVESCSGYGTFSHGAAVAHGMRFAGLLAQREQGASPDFIQAQNEMLDMLELPKLDVLVKPDDLLNAMKRDKKTHDGQLRFVLAKDVANWCIQELADDTVRAALEVFA